MRIFPSFKRRPQARLNAFLLSPYPGLIYTSELYAPVRVGDEVHGRIVKIRPDGKADLALRKLAYAQMEEDSEMVYAVIKSYKGVLPFTDKADKPINVI